MTGDPRQIGDVLKAMSEENSAEGFLLQRVFAQARLKARNSTQAANAISDAIETYADDLRRRRP